MSESSHRVRRTFALKRRSENDEEFAFEPEAQPEKVVEAPEPEQLQYDGEIFDQFYRPLIKTSGEQGLTEIAAEPIGAAHIPRPISREMREDRSAEIKAAGEALAHQIYKLAQQIRETDLDVYLSAFNVVVGARPAKDARELLDYANAFFTEYYYTPIRERGERPEIFHQIVKRTGHETADRVNKIVKGLDIEASARDLWDLYHGPNPDKFHVITERLLDCTPKQVRALREEFLQIPYRDLARQIVKVLHHGERDSGEGKKTIGRTEVQEHRRRTSARSRDEAFILIYLLSGRTRDELDLIFGFYDQIERPEGDAGRSIEDDIRKRLQTGHAKIVLPILGGWAADRQAAELFQLLYPEGKDGSYDDLLSETRDSVERDLNTGLLPFHRRFKKRRVIREMSSLEDRIANVRELLDENLLCLTPIQEDDLRAELEKTYNIKLPETLWPSGRPFDPRLRAQELRDRLISARHPLEILRPLAFLSPRRALAIATAFRTMTGEDLSAVVNQRAAELSGGTLSPEMKEIIAIHLDGHGRWPLNLDLLTRYRPGHAPAGCWDVDYLPGKEIDEITLHIAETVNSTLDHHESLQRVRRIVEGHDPQMRQEIERAFFECSDPRTPLLQALDLSTVQDEEDRLSLLLGGFEVEQTVEALRADPSQAASLLAGQSFLAVSSVRNLFEARSGASLLEILEQTLSGFPLFEALQAALVPEVYRMREVLGDLQRGKPGLLDELREPWKWPQARRFAFERAYDQIFPRFRVHMKFAAARGAISASDFAFTILHFEGVPVEVVDQITEAFDAIDVDGLLAVLGDHKHDQPVIEECFDLLNEDRQLKRTVKGLQVPLDKINETLLHIEGFYPKDVASEIYNLVQKTQGEVLGKSILEILRTPDEVSSNARIPTDVNWIDEMCRQTYLAYGKLYKTPLTDDLRTQSVPTDLIEAVTERLFGSDVAGYARDLYKLIVRQFEESEDPDKSEERVASFIEMRSIRYRELILQAYRAHWEQLPGMGMLLEDLSQKLTSSTAKKKLINLLGTGTIRKLTGTTQGGQAADGAGVG